MRLRLRVSGVSGFPGNEEIIPLFIGRSSERFENLNINAAQSCSVQITFDKAGGSHVEPAVDKVKSQ